MQIDGIDDCAVDIEYHGSKHFFSLRWCSRRDTAFRLCHERNKRALGRVVIETDEAANTTLLRLSNVIKINAVLDSPG
jgi:hypothetical protein